MNKLYTAQEVADRLKIKKTTVYELIKRGELESSKIGKQLRVSEEQLTQYLNRSSSGNSESGQDIPYTSVNFEPELSVEERLSASFQWYHFRRPDFCRPGASSRQNVRSS